MEFSELLNATSLLDINPALLFVLIVWTVIWKGLALWKASHRESPVWFVVLLVVNTLGILEILYLFIFSEMKAKRKTEKAESKKRKKR